MKLLSWRTRRDVVGPADGETNWARDLSHLIGGDSWLGLGGSGRF